MTKRPTSGGNKAESGYGRPPKHSQYKPGQSGNLGGRPRRDRSAKGVFSQLLALKVSSSGGQKVTMAEAIMRQLFFDAAKGDHRARTQVFQLMEKWEIDAQEFFHHVIVELVKPPARDEEAVSKSKPPIPFPPLGSKRR